MALTKFNPQSMTDDQLLPATLLEVGDTLNFIETRKHSLRNEIKASKIDAGVGKVSNLAGMAGGAGLLILGNPLGILAIAGCTVGYGMAVFSQWLQTGKLQLMPLSSKTQEQRDAELASSTETGNAYDVAAIQKVRDSIRDDAAYLSDREKVEYELLHFSSEGLLSAMNHVHPTQRWACYQFLIDAFIAGTLQSYFQNFQSLRDVLGNPAIYTSHLPEASKRFPQYGLQSAGAITGEQARESFQPVFSTVGNTTRLNALDVESSPMVQTVASTGQNQASQDIAKSLAEHLQSTLIVGQPGAGKGLTIAYATRWIKQLHPECEIWAIDPKSDPSEVDYWKSCDRILNCPIRPFTPAEEMEGIQDAIDKFIADFQNSHAPMKLLIFDEALAVKEKTGKWFKGLMAGFNALCSMGRSSKQYGWLVSQSPNTDDFGISGGTRNVYRRVLLLAASNQGLIANRSTFFSGEPTQAQLSGTGRVYFDSIINSWGITPVYPDLVRDVLVKVEPQSRRVALESLANSNEAEHPIEQFYHGDSVAPDGDETDSDELAIRAEIKRLLSENPQGMKVKDFVNRCRKPVRGMPSDDVRFVLELMALENQILEDAGSFFPNSK